MSATALDTFARVGDQDWKLRVLVENLLDAAVIASRFSSGNQLRLDFVIFVAVDWVCWSALAELMRLLWTLGTFIRRVYTVPTRVSILVGRVKGDIREAGHFGSNAGRSEGHIHSVGDVGLVMEEVKESRLSKSSP